MTPELNLDFAEGEYRQWRKRVIAYAINHLLTLGTHFHEEDLEEWYDNDLKPTEAVRALLDTFKNR